MVDVRKTMALGEVAWIQGQLRGRGVVRRELRGWRVVAGEGGGAGRVSFSEELARDWSGGLQLQRTTTEEDGKRQDRQSDMTRLLDEVSCVVSLS